MKTNKVQKYSLRMCSLWTMALLALVALGGAAEPALGQQTIEGKFALPMEVRLGKALLPAGEYKFSVVTLGNIRSVDSIQMVGSQVLVAIWSTAKGGPFASVVAMASRGAETPNPRGLDIRADGTGMMIHSMCLEKLKLVLQFNENKTKNARQARGTSQPQEGTSIKGSD